MMKERELKEGRIQGWIEKSTEMQFHTLYHALAGKAAAKGERFTLGDFLDLVIKTGLKALEEKK